MSYTGAATYVVEAASSCWRAYVEAGGWTATRTLFGVVGALSLSTLLLPWLLTFFTYRRQSLKQKYGATWALVTGGSSGIGKSLAHQLAAQGLNVVVAALEVRGDLTAAVEELRRAHPTVQFRGVSVDLGAETHETYLAPLAAATADIHIQVVFLNAGYVVTNFFAGAPLTKWLANVNCNAVSAMAVAHHFVSRLRSSHQRGCIVFTSSPANIIPSPFSITYGATKAFITHFATSLACEVGPDGIDVSVVHPSPTATRFYDSAHALPTLKMFQSTAIGPDAVADVMIRGVGRSVIIDQGYYPIVFRLLMRLVDMTFLADLLAFLAPTVKDYKYLKEAEGAKQHAAVAKVHPPTPVGSTTSLEPAPNSAKRARAGSVSKRK